MEKQIAFVSSDRMGDSLIGMVAVNNLCRAGYTVTVFSDYLFQLRDWFPGFSIRSYPHTFKSKVDWQDFERVVVLFDRPFVSDLKSHHRHVEVMSESELFRSSKSMVDIQLDYCRCHWGIANPVRDNGIASVKTTGRLENRVVLHPTSVDPFKIWPQEKFLRLAEALRRDGLKPVLVVAPNERPDWQRAIEQGYEVACFESLSEVAGFLAESQYFIGCDSGLGHLASCLGVPTATIAIRKGTARLWAPSWHVNEVILAPSWLFCRPLKSRFWKRALSPQRVMSGFRRVKGRAQIN
ncbi:glycosyltransferase family 9 protein [Gilvimarinus sp. SDUM040013]|uniref:Glycosyltransferase family 9 protein n=1 Tax=Gilvimarinus gilvus TaxID=3058038 RepID=A0ABU4S039_9GAMM|nr:glycosyltransferase family 9 protein [Gilvimarinus sp. SDUM040013]MDO3387399.1 glycosyltransferase family 9 protein [Gilvimarinus sp. SDUM040013]MDX6849876.1 glycosyltransferase family 9 protein [Gilvimarinus sp. SDUM040013]